MALSVCETIPSPQPLHPRSESACTQYVAQATTQPSGQKVPGQSHPASAVLINQVLRLFRQCYLAGMVADFAELGGAIGLFPTAVPLGLRLTWSPGRFLNPRSFCSGLLHTGRQVPVLPLLLFLRPAVATASKSPLLGSRPVGQHAVVEPVQTEQWPTDTRGYPSAFGLHGWGWGEVPEWARPVHVTRVSGEGGGLCQARLPDPRVFSPTEC